MASNRPVVYRSRINDIKTLSTKRYWPDGDRSKDYLGIVIQPTKDDIGDAKYLEVGQFLVHPSGELPFTIAELDTQYSSVGAIDSINPVTFDADSDGTVARFVDFSNSINLLEENFWIVADSDGHEHNMLGAVLDFGPEIPGNGGEIIIVPLADRPSAAESAVSTVDGVAFKTFKVIGNLESQNVGPANVSLVSGNAARVSVLNGEVLSENAAIGNFTINRSYNFVLDVRSGSSDIFAKRGARSVSGDMRSNPSTTSGHAERIINSISGDIVSDNCVTEIIGSLKWYVTEGSIESGISTASGNASYHQPPISGDIESGVSTIQGRGGDRVTVLGEWSASISQASGAGLRTMKISGSIQSGNSLISSLFTLTRKISTSIESTESLVSGVSERKIVSTGGSLQSFTSFTSSETGRTVRGFGDPSALSSSIISTGIVSTPFVNMGVGELYVEMAGTLYVRNVAK